MNGKPTKGSLTKGSLEVESDQLRAELIEIKERVGALETIASISNKPVVESYVRTYITNPQRRQIMRECAEPRTREYLMLKCDFASAQALDYHLGPLREGDLIRQHFDDTRTQTFEWSNLFRRLPKAVIRALIDDPKPPKSSDHRAVKSPKAAR